MQHVWMTIVKMKLQNCTPPPFGGFSLSSVSEEPESELKAVSACTESGRLDTVSSDSVEKYFLAA